MFLFVYLLSILFIISDIFYFFTLNDMYVCTISVLPALEAPVTTTNSDFHSGVQKLLKLNLK